MTVEPEHITTEQAAEIVGKSVNAFTTWAHRRGLKAVAHRRGRGHGAAALWRAADVYDATRGEDVVLLPIVHDTPTQPE